MKQISNNSELDELIRNAKQVDELVVLGLGIRSLAGLESIECRSISISGVYHSGCNSDESDTIEDFSVINRIEGLEEVLIRDCRNFGNAQLSLVANCKGLVRFELSSFLPSVSDISPLYEASTLRYLNLQNYLGRHTHYGPESPDLFELSERLREQVKLLPSRLPNCTVVI